MQAEEAAEARRGAAPTTTPLSAAECSAVLIGLRDGTLDWYDVQKRIISAVQGGRQWTTGEWKALRERLIGNHCQQCETTTGPMVLQHFWHPATVDEIVRDLQSALREAAWTDYHQEYAASDGLQDLEVLDGPPRRGCPKCDGYSIQERKRTRGPGKIMHRFRCMTVRNKQPCGHEFDEPNTVQPTRVISVETQRRAAFEEFYNPVFRSLERQVYTTATMRAVEEFSLYMSGEGTATFCRRCAYMWDKRGLRLCMNCCDGWHTPAEELCGACRTGRRYVLCATCGQERHSDKYPTCYTCRLSGGATTGISGPKA